MNKNVEYNPTPVYNRKAYREILRNRVIALNGYHDVNKTMGRAFRKHKETKAEN